ncbi:MAG TPA: hypothetical protein VH082_11140 [Rudaea sp.]|jgi:hypothetical protein|nr:hypothetical protein [Rudaea sp.]
MLVSTRTLTIVLIAALSPLSGAIATTDSLNGQWTGNSKVEGDQSIAKTFLSLGAPDNENATLRIEGRNTCTLRQGSYRADTAGAWTMSFKDTMGGDACTRLAKGTFTLRPGSTPRQLDFDVTYPGSDGKDVRRRGALTRYP